MEGCATPGIRLSKADVCHLDDIVSLFLRDYVSHDPCWRSTGFFDEPDSWLGWWCIREARKVFLEDIESGGTVVAVDEKTDEVVGT